MIKSKNLLHSLLILGFLGISAIALAQEQSVSTNTTAINLEEITAEELGVQEPNILPDSPFYFLKDLSRNIQSFFVFNPVKKIELKNKFANEKLLEAKKLVEKSKNPETIKKALDKYQEALSQIKDRADKIKGEAADSPEAQKFLEKFEAQKELHQRILQKMENKIPEQVLEKIKESREKHLEKFKEVMEKIQEKKIERKPAVCTTDYNPVCGKDNKTYSNKCAVKSAGVEIDYQGECGQKKVSCKSDSDCACGRNKETKECAFGNKEYINDGKEAQCPDFCSGIGGNFEIKCVKNQCQIITMGTGAIKGKITIGPLCPVEPCQNQQLNPYAERKVVLKAENKSETITIEFNDASGNFSKSGVPTGIYKLTITKCEFLRCKNTLPKIVKIETDKTTEINIDIDTGIR